MATTETVPQPEPERVELRPKVLKITYLRIMTECARTRTTQGEVLDRLAELLESAPER